MRLLKPENTTDYRDTRQGSDHHARQCVRVFFEDCALESVWPDHGGMSCDAAYQRCNETANLPCESCQNQKSIIIMCYRNCVSCSQVTVYPRAKVSLLQISDTIVLLVLVNRKIHDSAGGVSSTGTHAPCALLAKPIAKRSNSSWL